MDLKHIFGKNIKHYRYNQQLTQAELAEKANISVKYLGRLERGLHSADFDVIENLANALKVKPFELFIEPQNINLPHRVDMQNK